MINKKMHVTLSMVALFFATFTLNGWAQEPKTPAASKPAGQVETNGTSSHPNQVDQLLDQIDLRVEFPDGAKFVVSTRPAEFVYVTKPAGTGTEKRLSFVIVPTPFGEDPIPRDQLKLRPPESIGFRFVPFCLNGAGSPRATDKSSPASCFPRPANDTGGDFVFPLSEGQLKKSDIAVNEPFQDPVTGAVITVLDFRPRFLGVAGVQCVLQVLQGQQGHRGLRLFGQNW